MKRTSAPRDANESTDEEKDEMSSGNPTHVGLLASPPKRPKLKSYKSDILNSQWEAMYLSLLEYKARTGNCLVPHRYSENPALGAWVSTQRRQFKVFTEGRAWTGKANSTPIDPYRVARLDEIGFAWTTDNPIKIPWKRRFQELVDYKKVHGHCLVPSVYEKNIKLGHWVSTQRHQAKALKQGRPSRMTPEHIKALSDIGFAWVAPKGASRSVKKRLADEFRRRHDEEEEEDDEYSTDHNDGNTSMTTKPPPSGHVSSASAKTGSCLVSEGNGAPESSMVRNKVLPAVNGSLAPAAVVTGNRSLLTYNDMQHPSTMILPSSLLASSHMRLGAFGSSFPGFGLFNRESHGQLAFGGTEPLLAAHQMLMANSIDRALLSGAYGNLFGSNSLVLDTRLSLLRETQLLEQAELALARASNHPLAPHFAKHMAGTKK